MPKKSSKGNGNYSVMAIVAFVFSLLFFIPLASVVAIILGIISILNISKNKLKGKGLAITAIIIGSIVTIAYIVVIIFLVSTFGFVTNFDFENPTNNINVCMEKQGLAKDMCVLITVASSVNSTTPLNENTCDLNVKDKDLKGMCNAILKRDDSYCAEISNSDARIDCYGMIAELKNALP